MAQPPAKPPTPIRVITFDGGWNLPMWAAIRQGFFEANGVKVVITHTPNSQFLITGILEDRFDVGLAVIDNLVAYQEGQGEAKIRENSDLFGFMGSDSGLVSLVTAPDVKRFADIKGKILSVDALTTGLAFVLRELLARNGIVESDVTFERAGGTSARYQAVLAGKHAGTILRTPFDLLAKERGFNQLATEEALGAYQGTTGIARRSWARQNEQALIGFLRGYRAGMDWVHDPKNRDIVEALLVANVRDLTPALAKQAYELLLPGLTRDTSINMKGFQTALELRSKYAQPPKKLSDTARYLDMSYHRKAFARP